MYVIQQNYEIMLLGGGVSFTLPTHQHITSFNLGTYSYHDEIIFTKLNKTKKDIFCFPSLLFIV